MSKRLLTIFLSLLFSTSVFAQNTHMLPEEIALRAAPFGSLIEPVKMTEDEAQPVCLALAIYHEARGEPHNGQEAVGAVILNRAKENGQTICATLWADGGSQFQWTRRSISRLVPVEPDAWTGAQEIAIQLLDYPSGEDPTHGATMFFDPRFGRHLSGRVTARIGHHIFIKPLAPLPIAKSHATRLFLANRK